MATRNIVPRGDLEGNLGLPDLRWLGIYAGTITGTSLSDGTTTVSIESLVQGIGTLTPHEIEQLSNINNVVITNAQWGYVGSMTGIPITDAPIDGDSYVRKDGAWESVEGVEVITAHDELTGLLDDDHPQYHNDARALAWLLGRSTSDISEGSNLYYTASRVTTEVFNSGRFVDGSGIDFTVTPASSVTAILDINSLTNETVVDKTLDSLAYNDTSDSNTTKRTPITTVIANALPNGIIGPTSGTWVNNNNGTITIPTIKVRLFNNADWSGSASEYTVTGGTTGTEFTALVDLDTNYIYIDYNAGTPQFVVTTAEPDYNRSDRAKYVTVFRDANDIHVIEWGMTAEGLSNKLLQRAYETNLFERASGLLLSAGGNSPLQANISGGVIWSGVNKVTTPNINSWDDTFSSYYHSGGSWTHTNTGAGAGVVNNTHYDNGTNLVALGSGKFVVNWIYKGVESAPHVYQVIGTAEYNSLSAAQDEGIPPLPEILETHAILVGRIITQQGSTTVDVQSVFEVAFSGNSSVSSHANLTNLQGGIAGEYYHLSAAQHTIATTQAASGVTGYLSGTDWNTFNSKLGNLVEDTTPQLGGTLDANNFNIDMGVNVITDPKVGQWQTAYGWGDHSTAGYLTSYTETDPVFSASAAAGITSGNITDWNTAFSWGDHSGQGYVTSTAEGNYRIAVFTGATDAIEGDPNFTWDGTEFDVIGKVYASYTGAGSSFGTATAHVFHANPAVSIGTDGLVAGHMRYGGSYNLIAKFRAALWSSAVSTESLTTLTSGRIDGVEAATGHTIGTAYTLLVGNNRTSGTGVISAGYGIYQSGGSILDKNRFNSSLGLSVDPTANEYLKINVNTATKAHINFKPSAGTDVSSPNQGDLWFNGTNLYFHDGTSNTDLLSGGGSVTGSGVANRLAYWNGTSTLTSDIDLTFDGNTLRIGNGSGVSNVYSRKMLSLYDTVSSNDYEFAGLGMLDAPVFPEWAAGEESGAFNFTLSGEGNRRFRWSAATSSTTDAELMRLVAIGSGAARLILAPDSNTKRKLVLAYDVSAGQTDTYFTGFGIDPSDEYFISQVKSESVGFRWNAGRTVAFDQELMELVPVSSNGGAILKMKGGTIRKRMFSLYEAADNDYQFSGLGATSNKFISQVASTSTHWDWRVGTGTSGENTIAILDPLAGLQVKGQITFTYTSNNDYTPTGATQLDCDYGNSFTIDLGSATTTIPIGLTNQKKGNTYFIKVIQGANGVNIQWPSGTKWPGGTAPTITTTNNAVDTIVFYYDGTDLYGNFAQDYS